MEKKVTKNTRIDEILQANNKAVEILFQEGLHCICCPMSMNETLEQGCKAHGMNDKKIKQIVERLNR